MEERVRTILTDLERVRENLLALSDDIWLSIDHNDADALKEGVQFKLAYNQRLDSFTQSAEELSGLIQKFTSVPLNAPEPAEGGKKGSAENERIIRELDRSAPHTLEESFIYKRPYGFVLQGKAYQEVPTWRRVYELVCQQMAEKDPKRVAALPTNPKFITKYGHKAFSKDQKELRVGSHIADGVYVEVHFSANGIRDGIKDLLAEFGVDPADMAIYLREDRDAGNE
jgi:hypothetical protein